METFKLVVFEKNDFENLHVQINNIFGIFGPSRIGNKKNIRTKGSVLTLKQQLPEKQRKHAIIF